MNANHSILSEPWQTSNENFAVAFPNRNSTLGYILLSKGSITILFIATTRYISLQNMRLRFRNQIGSVPTFLRLQLMIN